MRTNVFTIAALIGLFSLSLPLASEIIPSEVEDKDVQAEPTVVEPVRAGSRLRCWQYGELLFEESGISGKADNRDIGSILFERQGNKQGRLHLVALGEATCLYEE